MIELFEFQHEAADRIADRFRRHYEDPPERGTRKHKRVVPFFQALASITASGKTAILADAVATMSSIVAIEPLVLWLSKGKVVVQQTYANLASGGKYHHLLGSATVSTLAQYDMDEVAEATEPVLYFATVGTFNQKDKERGDRAIYRSDIDCAETSTWEALKVRANADRMRRPLIVVYDEGHNLTDQQTALLLELEPDALLVASATMRWPAALTTEIGHLQAEGWGMDELVTTVDAKAVAESGLVKSTVELAGYAAPMEETVNSLLDDMRQAEEDATAAGIGKPKAIYVCKTNIIESDSFRLDDPKRPFRERQAPPILIWRYLTEQGGVKPDDIAVYCSLKFDRGHPPPEGFHLFSGGERDYDSFTAGAYRHVIFNLGLQEGWDDPLCYFAYIDKSMESNVQVEQVIGRLLRQPGAKRYPVESLNAAHFYVRVDRRGVFNELIQSVGKKLKSEAPEIKLVKTAPGSARPRPVEPRAVRFVHETAYDAREAVGPIQDLLDGLSDYRRDPGENIRSVGGRTSVQRVVGDDALATFTWEEFEHTNMVSARWIFRREVARRFRDALDVAPTDMPKFDALVGFGSSAHKQIASTAERVVDAYLEGVVLRQRPSDLYEVGPMLVRRHDETLFENSLHVAYSDLNDLEFQFADAIDTKGLSWCRNPSQSGYHIPLVSLGRTRNFYPDFLVWKDDDVFALDTTGGHLLHEKAGRKLLAIAPPNRGGGRLIVRLISPGHWNANIEQIDSGGFTVWALKQDRSLRPTKVYTVAEAVECALAPPI
ncbi:MAG TPA: hypothetical protein VFQ14_01420 [Thermoleophilaceae bacterium]|nr:hypothetical protein [Thermoleophilaceae bacterium]